MLHVSQQIALDFHVTTLLHVPHGYLGALGPGISSVSADMESRRIKIYVLLGLVALCFSLVIE